MFTVKPPHKSSCSTSEKGCCSPAPKGSGVCPQCGKAAKKVLSKTLDALLTPEAKSKIDVTEGFFFCKIASCKVVYFKASTLLTQEDVNVTVGLKEGASPRTICYCFNYTAEMIEEEITETGKSKAKETIKSKMNSIGCACEIKNPSGGCCLGDIGKAIRDASQHA